jgi:hypothetical protein
VIRAWFWANSPGAPHTAKRQPARKIRFIEKDDIVKYNKVGTVKMIGARRK